MSHTGLQVAASSLKNTTFVSGRRGRSTPRSRGHGLSWVAARWSRSGELVCEPQWSHWTRCRKSARPVRRPGRGNVPVGVGHPVTMTPGSSSGSQTPGSPARGMPGGYLPSIGLARHPVSVVPPCAMGSSAGPYPARARTPWFPVLIDCGYVDVPGGGWFNALHQPPAPLGVSWFRASASDQLSPTGA